MVFKRNEATECCVTNGAEAIVVGWNSHVITGNKQVLDTLFVKLKNPPTDIQLDDLPLNVVDLHNCRSHQSVYTCLSRSASIDGTILVQGFDPS